MDKGETSVDRRAWVALAITSLSLYMVVLDASAVNVAFPSVQRDLDASRSTLSWMISAYGITTASFLLMAGHLADSIGRRKVFTWSLLIFIGGSALAGVAPSFEVLVAGRVIQGVGAAGVSPTSLALCLPLFPPERRPTAIGIWGSMASAGAATGPTIGSVLINSAGWRAIFWINVPIGLAAIALTIRKVPESRSEPRSGPPLDQFGVPMATLGVALLMLAIVQSDAWGLSDPRIILLITGGLILLPLAIQRSRTHPQPAVDLSLFRIRSYWPAVLVMGIFGCGFLAGFLTTTLYLQNLWGLGVLQTGLALSPGPIVGTVIGFFSGRVAERVGHLIPVSIGIAAMGGSYLFLYLTASADGSYLTGYLPATLMFGVGLGLSFANLTGMALSDVDPGRYAMANAMTRTIQQVAGALGIAVIVTILGTGTSDAADFKRAWLWIVTMFALALIAVVTFSPRKKPIGAATRP